MIRSRHPLLGPLLASLLGLVPTTAHAVSCDEVLSWVGRFPLDDIVRILEEDQEPPSRALWRCLRDAEAPPRILAAVERRLSRRVSAPVDRPLPLDPDDPDLATTLADALAAQVRLAFPGEVPVVIVRALPAELPDWLWVEADVIAGALRAALPRGSRAAEAPDVLGRDAEGLLDPTTAAERQQRLTRMGFRRLLDVTGTPEPGDALALRITVTDLLTGEPHTATLRVAPREASDDTGAPPAPTAAPSDGGEVDPPAEPGPPGEVTPPDEAPVPEAPRGSAPSADPSPDDADGDGVSSQPPDGEPPGDDPVGAPPSEPSSADDPPARDLSLGVFAPGEAPSEPPAEATLIAVSWLSAHGEDVLVDGSPVGQAPLVLSRDAEASPVRIEAGGRGRTVRLDPGATRRLGPRLGLAPHAGVAPGRLRRDTILEAIGYSALGAGVAVGTTSWALAMSGASPSAGIDQTLRVGNTVGFSVAIVGGALALWGTLDRLHLKRVHVRGLGVEGSF